MHIIKKIEDRNNKRFKKCKLDKRLENMLTIKKVRKICTLRRIS